MTDETSQQVIRVYTDRAPRTIRELFHLLRLAAYAAHHLRHHCHDPVPPPTGEQTMQDLNLYGKPLEKLVFRDDKLESLRQALKDYGVDYAVLPSTEKEGVEVWFRSQDINRIESAVQYVEKELTEELSDTAHRLDERLEEARTKVAEHNASIPNPIPEKAHKKDLVL